MPESGRAKAAFDPELFPQGCGLYSTIEDSMATKKGVRKILKNRGLLRGKYCLQLARK
jgi:hypothetical protein